MPEAPLVILPNDGHSSGGQEMISAEQEKEIISFARRLADNEKANRDVAVKQLRTWLGKKSNLTESDLLKIWKGLFYCMWMSDKAPVQQELAATISKLIHCFGTNYNRVSTFIITFWR